MKKILIFLLLLPIFAYSQKTYFSPAVPPASVSFSPSFRNIAGDSLSTKVYLGIGGNQFWQIPTWPQMRLAISGGSGGAFLPLNFPSSQILTTNGHTLTLLDGPLNLTAIGGSISRFKTNLNGDSVFSWKNNGNFLIRFSVGGVATAKFGNALTRSDSLWGGLDLSMISYTHNGTFLHNYATPTANGDSLVTLRVQGGYGTGKNVATLSTLVGGSGGTNGTYTAMPTTGSGNGIGLTITFTVSGGTVGSLPTIANRGYNYTAGDVITVTGVPGLTGFSFHVATIGSYTGLTNIGILSDRIQTPFVPVANSDVVNLAYLNAHPGVNIYNTDGSLTGNRLVGLGSNSLEWAGNNGTWALDLLWDNTVGGSLISLQAANAASTRSSNLNVSAQPSAEYIEMTVHNGGTSSAVHLDQTTGLTTITDGYGSLGAVYNGFYTTNQRLQRLSIPSVNTVIALADSIKATIGGSTGANPTASITFTPVNGSASTFTRSDGAPKADSTVIQSVLNFFPKADTRYYTKTASDAKYALQATTITAGTGLSGGGSLAANRTISADTTVLQTVLNFFPKGDTRYGRKMALTAVKTANYTLVPYDVAVGDAVAGTFTFSLTNAPADGTIETVKMANTSGTNTISLATLGVDIFNGGSTSATLTLNYQAITFQYKLSNHTWYSVSTNLALGLLDSRYAASISGTGYSKWAATIPSFVTAIPNGDLANSSITINGNAVSLGGSTTVTASTTAALTMNNGGAGAASGTTFDGGTARTISYNTIGASPLAGSSSFTTIGTIGSSPYTTAGVIHNSVTTGAFTSSLVSLTADVTNILPVANGGTGVSALGILTPGTHLSGGTYNATANITLSTDATATPAASVISTWDANKNLSANSLIEGYTTTANAAGTTTLTVSSTEVQFCTGSGAQNVALPVASTLVLGQQFIVYNISSGTVTVQSSGANTVLAMSSGMVATYTCILTSGTTAASWDVKVSGTTTYTGTGGIALNNSPSFITPSLGSATATNIATSTGSATGTFTEQQTIAATPTDGLYMRNPTAATAGVPLQISPSIRFSERIWNTTATAASNEADFYITAKGVSAATPTAQLVFSTSLVTTTTPSYTDRISIGNNGDLTFLTAGQRLLIKEGSNASMGTGTLAAGTLVVSNTLVTANSRIFLTDEGGGVLANIGALYISARSAGTSFTVSSSNALDTSTFSWLIVEPAP